MLENLRDEIDKIDDEIAHLYNKRMKIVKKIGVEKAKSGTALLNTNREKDIINRVTNFVDKEIYQYAKNFFETIFETSKNYQKKFGHTYSITTEKIKKLILAGEIDFPLKADIACQGIAGSYSSIATEKLFSIPNISFFGNFEGVFNAVEHNICEYGVLPIENSSVGSVNIIYDLMKKYNFYISRSIKLKIDHTLLAKKGTDFSKIKTVFSHEQAISQCQNFFKDNPNIKIEISPNTAIAAKFIAESERDDIACISSRECADIYNLSILKTGIQSQNNNYTRFICISKNLNLFKNSNKISIMINLSHKPGSLNKLLAKFASLNLNLTKLESRPIENRNFEFMFYFDFDADIKNNNILELIAELETGNDEFKFLGSYYEIN